MLSLPIVSSVVVAFGLLSSTVLAQTPILTLNCNAYKAVCDHTCYAVHCWDFNDPNQLLHYDAFSGTDKPSISAPNTTAANLRRAAIGCKAKFEGKGNYCAKIAPNTDCDEFPYASTYDGGLGCVPNRYPATGAGRTTADLMNRGTTRCSDPNDNQEHGRQLAKFYKNPRNNGVAMTDGEGFQLSFDPMNINNAPLCQQLIAAATPAARDTICDGLSGIYAHQSAPAADSYCPHRGGKNKRSYPPPARRSATPHTVTLEDGSNVTTLFGARPVVGSVVTRFGDDGEMYSHKVTQ